MNEFPNFYSWIIKRLGLDIYTAVYIGFTLEEANKLDTGWFHLMYEIERFKFILKKALGL